MVGSRPCSAPVGARPQNARQVARRRRETADREGDDHEHLGAMHAPSTQPGRVRKSYRRRGRAYKRSQPRRTIHSTAIQTRTPRTFQIDNAACWGDESLALVREKSQSRAQAGRRRERAYPQRRLRKSRNKIATDSLNASANTTSSIPNDGRAAVLAPAHLRCHPSAP
jgi:hypothetical protein